MVDKLHKGRSDLMSQSPKHLACAFLHVPTLNFRGRFELTGCNGLNIGKGDTVGYFDSIEV